MEGIQRRKIDSAISIPSNEVEYYYKQHINLYRSPEKIRIEYLVAEEIKTAQAALQLIEKGARLKDAAIEIVDQLESDIGNLHDSLIHKRAELRRLNANYDTTKEELIGFSHSIEREIHENQQRASETHQELIAVTTPDEWSALSKSDKKSVKTITRSLKGI